MSADALPILDRFDRVHSSLRISVTDRCNIRCFYCMPETVQFLPQKQILTFEEIARFTKIVAGMGVNKIRITGGEPLVRAELPTLIRMLVEVDGIDDVALTTNGMLLAEHADSLYQAGLCRINVSLDTLSEEVFQRISRRPGLDKVLRGIETARSAGFENLRLNAIAIRDLTENEIIPLAEFAIDQELELRFIEFMPLDADQNWADPKVLTGAEIRRTLEARFGSLQPIESEPSQPARDYALADGRGRFGFINSVSEPFCSTCNRMRLTSEGKLRNCLFSEEEWDIRELLRSETDDVAIAKRVRECIQNKKAGHGTDNLDFLRPDRAMYQIGG